MPYETVSYSVADRVATVAMNRPEARNALSDQLLDDLIAALTAARDDDGVRCVVLTSTHEKVFSAGGDLGGFASEQPLMTKHFATDRFPRLFHLIGELGKPSICAANGHVLAGALGLALACDLIIAKEGARFGTPEINVGVFPFMIMALIYRNVGRKKTNELLLLGEQIDAHEAERIGIVRIGQPGAGRWSVTPIVSSIRIELDETAVVRPSKAWVERPTGSAGSTTMAERPLESSAEASVRPARPPPKMITSARSMARRTTVPSH